MTRPSREELVRTIIAGTAGLELLKGEEKHLPPLGETYGPFIITGNSNPEIRYITFDEALMEFVHMTVALNLPDKVLSSARTEDLGEVVVKRQYLRPFNTLAQHLYRYFPLMPDQKRNVTNVL